MERRHPLLPCKSCVTPKARAQTGKEELQGCVLVAPLQKVELSSFLQSVMGIFGTLEMLGMGSRILFSSA